MLNYVASVNTRAVRKVSSLFEYLENRSRGLEVIWQPVRGDVTVHPRTISLQWGLSFGSGTPLTELVYCVTVEFTNFLNIKGDFSFEKNEKSQGAKSRL